MRISPETLSTPVALSVLVVYLNLLLWVAYWPVSALYPKCRKRAAKINSSIFSLKKRRKPTQPLADAIYAIE